MDEKEAEARPVMGTIFLVLHCLYILIDFMFNTYRIEVNSPNFLCR